MTSSGCGATMAATLAGTASIAATLSQRSSRTRSVGAGGFFRRLTQLLPTSPEHPAPARATAVALPVPQRKTDDLDGVARAGGGRD